MAATALLCVALGVLLRAQAAVPVPHAPHGTAQATGDPLPYCRAPSDAACRPPPDAVLAAHTADADAAIAAVDRLLAAGRARDAAAGLASVPTAGLQVEARVRLLNARAEVAKHRQRCVRQFVVRRVSACLFVCRLSACCLPGRLSVCCFPLYPSVNRSSSSSELAAGYCIRGVSVGKGHGQAHPRTLVHRDTSFPIIPPIDSPLAIPNEEAASWRYLTKKRPPGDTSRRSGLRAIPNKEAASCRYLTKKRALGLR